MTTGKAVLLGETKRIFFINIIQHLVFYFLKYEGSDNANESNVSVNALWLVLNKKVHSTVPGMEETFECFLFCKHGHNCETLQ